MWANRDTETEVAASKLAVVPSRTWTCNAHEFRALRHAAKAGRPFCCLLPLLSPTSTRASIWLGLTAFIDLTYTAFVVALSLAFNKSASFNTPLGIMDLIGSSVYLLDLAMGFHLGVIGRWQDRAVVVRDGRTSARFYVRHGTFWMDLVATLPLFAQIAMAITGQLSPAIRFVYMLRLLRLVRVFRLLSNLSRSSVDGPLQFLASAMTTRTLLLLHALFSLCLLVNLLGCMWWNLAVTEGLVDSWATAITKDFDLLTASDGARWLVSCYFALTTMVTIGYGDITPVTIREVGVTMLFEVIGVAFFGYLLNVVTSLLTASGPAAKRVEAIRNKLEEVEEAMAQVEMSSGLRRNIRHFFSTSWEPPQGQGLRAGMFSELPAALRQRMVAQRERPLLRDLGFLPPGQSKREEKACCVALAAASAPFLLAPGQPLSAALPDFAAAAAAKCGADCVTQGPLPSCGGPFMFLLGEGRMALAGGAVIAAPALLGLAELFAADSALRAALGGDGGSSSSCHQAEAAVALSACDVVRLDCSQLYPLLRHDFPGLLQHLASKLLCEVQAGATCPPPNLQPPPNGAHQQQQQQQQGDAATVAAQVLRQLCSELEAEKADKAAASGKSGAVAGGPSLLTQRTSLDSGWEEAEGHPELAGVAVPAAGPLAFVWHCD